MSGLDSDIRGILNLIRTHIEVRNRSWMKRVHRDCFIASEAVDFLVQQGLADSRKQATDIGNRMVKLNMILAVSSRSKKFKDEYLYFRFTEDDDEESSILSTTNAGNGQGTYLGHGGCKFSFCPHTVHNSYVINIALAEEIERAVAGASVEARTVAFNKLRGRVKEEVLENAPDWDLAQSTDINKTNISIFERKRPRGDQKNVKMCGMVASSAKDFVKGIMSFSSRKHWEQLFEDGVVVEAVDIGEKTCPIYDDDSASTSPTSPTSANATATTEAPSLPDYTVIPSNLARKTDDVLAFLQTVDVAGIPPGMPIAFLNDPERQHALAHLRKQMMLSNPQECMLCGSEFESGKDIRFCPCCAMISCASCVSKRVFEVVARQVVSICIHCFRESSRVRHPPQAVRDTTGINAQVVGKWWRPEDLGIVDYSQSGSLISSKPSFIESAAEKVQPLVPGLNLNIGLDEMDLEGGSSTTIAPPPPPETKPKKESMSSKILSKLGFKSSKTASDTGGSGGTSTVESDDEKDEDEEGVDGDQPGFGDGVGRGVVEEEFVKKVASHGNLQQLASSGTGGISPASPSLKGLESPSSHSSTTGFSTVSQPIPIASGANSTANGTSNTNTSGFDNTKMAKCKNCGLEISRDMEAIEEHMAECVGILSSKARTASVIGSYQPKTLVFDGSTLGSLGNAKSLAGISRRPELERHGTRIIYRTARPPSKGIYAPREVCCLQDAFVDQSDGTCYVYEISVRHCDVRGMAGYVTADVMLLIYAAKPVKGVKNMCSITVVSQVDTRMQGGQWLLSFLSEGGSVGNEMGGGFRKEDLVREMKAAGELQNILAKKDDGSEENSASLDDFDLLAVLGRGGFGKVMQVRHRQSNEVYAMKILKKSELRRRRQVERTQTERTILAAVRHPFIVCLHYAFQNTQKLYMIMDFVQGGDFFTLMRKFKRLPEDWVKLYVAEIAMALQYLHDMDVVYRDLKPENILLDGGGHIKLTDFGLSRFFESRPPAAEDMIEEKDFVTRSFCGTEQYMSPEMLLQQGHNHRMDWWCLGLLMHEMISARHPFQGPSHYDTLRNMVTKQPNIDSRLSPNSAIAVRCLLVKNPKARLCCKTGISELKETAFFATVDWDKLFDRNIEMPYKPELKGATDISSFETTFTKEAPVDSIGDASDGKKKKEKKGGGLLGMFGLGGGADKDKKEDGAESDVFEGFSFTKDDKEEKDGQNQQGGGEVVGLTTTNEAGSSTPNANESQ